MKGILMTKLDRFSTPTQYRIKLKECLDAKWYDAFEDMAISFEGGGTVLTGAVADQAALHGLLIRIRDLNLNLLSLERVEPVQADKGKIQLILNR